MNSIRTVVCPVDFSLATSRQTVWRATSAARLGALVVHHNVTDVSGAAVGWMWHADHVPVAPGLLTNSCV